MDLAAGGSRESHLAHPPILSGKRRPSTFRTFAELIRSPVASMCPHRSPRALPRNRSPQGSPEPSSVFDPCSIRGSPPPWPHLGNLPNAQRLLPNAFVLKFYTRPGQGIPIDSGFCERPSVRESRLGRSNRSAGQLISPFVIWSYAGDVSDGAIAVVHSITPSTATARGNPRSRALVG